MIFLRPPVAFFAKPRRSSGYILFEIMLAMAIFCCVAIGLANGLGHTADSMLGSNRESQIRLILESRLAENRVFPVTMGTQSDTSEDPTVTIEHEWEPVKMVNSNNIQLNNLYELSVRAKWMEGGQPRNQEAKIMIFRPVP